MRIIAPVPAKDREIFLDVLRGIAILGIFIVNLEGFSYYSPFNYAKGPFIQPVWDSMTLFIHHWFFEGKFYSIFSLLFGWGLALQFKRAAANEIDPNELIGRRLKIMLWLGGIHLLIWRGDIVFFYALVAFSLLYLRRFSNKQLMVLAVVLLLSPVMLYGLKMVWPPMNALSNACLNCGIRCYQYLLNINTTDEYLKLMQHSGWWEQFKNNVCGIFYRFQYLFFISRIPKVLGMFLIGFVVGRSGFYSRLSENKVKIKIFILIGLVVGIPANYMLAHYMHHFMADYWQLKMKGLYQTVAFTLGVVPLALSYAAILALAFQTTVGRKILTRVAPVGKMAFSNYMLQSLVGSYVFLSPGLGFIWRVGPFAYTIFAVCVFSLQLLLSTLWLKYFAYGPIEWLWRSLTYRELQRIMK